MSSRAGQREGDAAVVVQPEARVVSHLPRMPVEIAKRAGVAAVEGLHRHACDLGAVHSYELDCFIHLYA